MIDFNDLDAAIAAKKNRDRLNSGLEDTAALTDIVGGVCILTGRVVTSLSDLATACGYESRQALVADIAQLLIQKASQRLSDNAENLSAVGVANIPIVVTASRTAPAKLGVD